MINIVEANFSRPAMVERLQEMLLLGLGGLGVEHKVAADVAARLAKNQLNEDLHLALLVDASTFQ
jgi:hypothetical protein